MSVRIVTDSTADLPPEVAGEMGITVVPLNVMFGLDTYQDGVNIQADEFYKRLQAGPIVPKTAAPSPGLFAETYQRLAAQGSSVVSIHISSKLSGTHNAALAGRQEAGEKCRVEVIDSHSVSMGLGLLAIAAAKAAKAGASLDEVAKLVRDSMPRVWMAGSLDTLEFLQKGGRIGKAQAWVGTLLSIKPLISIHEGEVLPLERVRTRTGAVQRLLELSSGHLPAREAAAMYSTEAAEADRIMAHLKGLFPQQDFYVSRFGPVLGTYVGPGCLAVFTLS